MKYILNSKILPLNQQVDLFFNKLIAGAHSPLITNVLNLVFRVCEIPYQHVFLIL